MRPEGTESTPPGAGPHQALHTPRHLTAVFRRGETCPEAGSKRAIHSDKAGALPLATGFPLETVQVRVLWGALLLKSSQVIGTDTPGV